MCIYRGERETTICIAVCNYVICCVSVMSMVQCGEDGVCVCDVNVGCSISAALYYK